MSVQEILTALRRLPTEQRRQAWAELDELRRSDPEAPVPKPLSAYDKAKHLIGPGSGIRDLASNPTHMEGYGRDRVR